MVKNQLYGGTNFFHTGCRWRLCLLGRDPIGTRYSSFFIRPAKGKNKINLAMKVLDAFQSFFWLWKKMDRTFNFLKELVLFTYWRNLLTREIHIFTLLRKDPTPGPEDWNTSWLSPHSPYFTLFVHLRTKCQKDWFQAHFCPGSKFKQLSSGRLQGFFGVLQQMHILTQGVLQMLHAFSESFFFFFKLGQRSIQIWTF